MQTRKIKILSIAKSITTFTVWFVVFICLLFNKPAGAEYYLDANGMPAMTYLVNTHYARHRGCHRHHKWYRNTHARKSYYHISIYYIWPAVNCCCGPPLLTEEPIYPLNCESNGNFWPQSRMSWELTEEEKFSVIGPSGGDGWGNNWNQEISDNATADDNTYDNPDLQQNYSY